MPKSRFLISVLLAMLLLATQAIYVGAAPAAQEEEGTPITGNVDEVLVEVDSETKEVTVVVTITSEGAEPQTIRLDLGTAMELGLVAEDTENPGSYVVPDGAVGSEIEVDPTTALMGEEEKEHPVGSKISAFFSDLLGVDYDTIMTYHDEGVGFGVLAQALWMTKAMDGDTAMFSMILEAKRSGDYSLITFEDGSHPKNWGQFRKEVMSDRDKSKENLGAVMSGRADKEGIGTGLDMDGKSNNGIGNDKGQDKDNGKGKAEGKKKEKK